MHFTPDTETNLAFYVDLANTHPTASRTGSDEMATPEMLTELLDRHGFTGRFDRDDAELAEGLAVRDEVR